MKRSFLASKEPECPYPLAEVMAGPLTLSLLDGRPGGSSGPVASCLS